MLLCFGTSSGPPKLPHERVVENERLKNVPDLDGGHEEDLAGG